ncbi:MAG TPA: hypothetical protein VL443_23970 [Cyclobacteriaceae bacterium]|jgi:hypothetical protein|nr:hypothetical protein [Cyclobacteriaceae bacterium]
MQIINSLHDLKKHPPTSDTVYVKTAKKLFWYDFQLHGWIAKTYFTSLEVSAILGLKHDKIQRMIRHLEIRRRMNRSENMGYDDLKLLMKVVKIRKAEPCRTYKDIKKELGI